MTPAKLTLTLTEGRLTLTEVAEISGVPRRTLENWSKWRPWVFEAVVQKADKGRQKRRR